MKKIFTLLVLMCSLGVMAQEYTPLVREGVKWECVSEQIGWGDEKKVSYKIYFDGDSVKDDIRYKKCYIETESSKKIVALMREDINNKKVYIRYGSFPTEIRYNTPIIDGLDGVDADAEYLLYDFSEIGNSDVIKMASNTSGGYLAGAQIVKSTMLVGDKISNRSQVFDSNKKALYSIVEGVGFIPEFSTSVSIGVEQNLYEGTMLDFLFYDSDTDGWTNFSYFNRLVADDGAVLYESPNTYTPLVREGVKWNCKMVEDIDWGTKPDKITNYYIEFKGDTIIGDNTYKKCYYVFEDNRSLNTVPYAFLREDIVAKQVFVIYTSAYNGYVTSGGAYEKDIEELLYDFNDITNKNQRWAREFQELKTTTINAANEKYVVHTLYRWQGDVPCMYIAEGIGSVYNIKSPSELLHPYQDMATCDCNTLIEFVSFENEKGEIVFDANTLGLEEIKIAPQINVYYDGRCITVNAESVESIEIFDLQGRTVSNVSRSVVVDCGNIASGIYIVKVVTDRGVISQKVEI
ncbi:MAG: T9SS type A sorting domain-containing protein [Muribaculaceae bacterium]|nr:T9SS type A sorting domain-containing protein [Muribaculaceae bacterium]